MLEKLSPSELSILWVLLRTAPLSVREVHDAMDNGWAYTTTKTIMDRMVARGVLERRMLHGVYIYEPLITRAQGISGWVRFFADKILGLDHTQVVNMFAESDLYSAEDIEEMHELLSNTDEGDRDKRQKKK